MPRRTESRRARHLLALGLLLASSPLLALPEDAQQPVRVTADSARFDEASGEAVYRGNVLTQQGTLEVRGDSLTLKVDSKGALTTARTLGKPAHYQQKTDPAKGLVTADANEILFDNNTGVVTLIGNAILRQEGTSFTGPRIVYSTVRKQIEASSDASQRVQLVFPPSAMHSKPATGSKP